jgi:hypothetical protein
MADTRHPTFNITTLHGQPITHTSHYKNNMADRRHSLHDRPITHTSPYNMAGTRHPTFKINILHDKPITHTSPYNMADTRHPTFTITNLHDQPLTHMLPYNMAATITDLHDQPITLQHGRHHYRSTRPTNHITTWPPRDIIQSPLQIYTTSQSQYNMAATPHHTFTITNLHNQPITIQHGRHAKPYIHHFPSTYPSNHTHTSPYNMADEPNSTFTITNTHGHTSPYNMAAKRHDTST